VGVSGRWRIRFVGCMRCRRAVFGRRSASFVRFHPVFAVAALVVLGLPASARADGSFGRLFPGLPALNGQSAQQIADLAQTQLDPNADSENNCQRPAVAGPSCTPSGFTYFGQFIDHDLTLDTSPSPVSPVDPASLPNGRTLRLDLDSVYGGGPLASPQLYEADGKHFRTQADNGNGVTDLPRNPDGSAVLVEGRNDENEIISQIHNAFLRSHNRLIDEGKSFAEAQRFLTLHYQWIVLHDYLPHILGPDVETKGIRRMDARLHAAAPRTTMDAFSVAAFRFGHSQVRLAYELNETSGKIQVFSFTLPDLRGGRPLPAGRQIAWGNFFNELSDPADADGLNVSRRIDPLISSSLFKLPIPGAEAAGSNVLAFRNMIRAKFYGMPSGQSVAADLGLPVIPPSRLGLGPAWADGTPLWYYILAESGIVGDGRTLGPVGSAIVRGTFDAVLERDPKSITQSEKHFRPDPEFAGADGVATISDLFVFAGLVDGD
jgi:hypothetical protein